MIQRLKQFIEYKGVSVRKFCQICGITPSTIQTAITKNTSISTDKVELIAQNFRDLNMNWLFLGVGSMINEQNFDHTEPSSKAQKNTKTDENTNILVLELVRQIKELTAENTQLKIQLNNNQKTKNYD